MMSTGVDIPDLEFIVFLRQVQSRILFEQMLGRGTRKGERFPGKSHFTVFECFDGSLLEYFRTATGITSEPPEKPTRTIMEVIEDIWRTETGTTTFRCLVRRLQRINKQMAGKARERFGAFGVASSLATPRCLFVSNIAHYLRRDQLLPPPSVCRENPDE
jgi:type I restriction enzyme, R subunit